MSQKYALPCTCGSTIVVEPRHAGGTMTCEQCGKTVDVPKLREIRNLEPVQEEARRKRTGWSRAQGNVFVFGLLCLVIAAGSAYYTFAHRMHFDEVEKPQIEQIRFQLDIDDITLVDSWEFWKKAKGAQIASRPTPYYVEARKQVARMDQFLKFFGGLAAVGLVAMVASLVIPSSD